MSSEWGDGSVPAVWADVHVPPTLSAQQQLLSTLKLEYNIALFDFKKGLSNQTSPTAAYGLLKTLDDLVTRSSAFEPHQVGRLLYTTACLHLSLGNAHAGRALLFHLYSDIERVDDSCVLSTCCALLDTLLACPPSSLPASHAIVTHVLTTLTEVRDRLATPPLSLEAPSETGPRPGQPPPRVGCGLGGPGDDLAGSIEDIDLLIKAYSLRIALSQRQWSTARSLIKPLSVSSLSLAGSLAKTALEVDLGHHVRAIRILNALTDDLVSHPMMKPSTPQLSAVFYNNLGAVYHDQGKHALAAFCFTRAVDSLACHPLTGTFTPNHRGQALYNLGLSLLLTGDCSGAAKALVSSSALLHQDPRVWLRLAEAIIALWTAAESRSPPYHVIGRGRSRRLVIETPSRSSALRSLENLLETAASLTQAPGGAKSGAPAPPVAGPPGLSSYSSSSSFSSVSSATTLSSSSSPATSHVSSPALPRCITAVPALAFADECLRNALTCLENEREPHLPSQTRWVNLYAPREESKASDDSVPEDGSASGSVSASTGKKRASSLSSSSKAQHHASGPSSHTSLATAVHLAQSWVALTRESHHRALQAANNALATLSEEVMGDRESIFYARMYAAEASARLGQTAQALTYLSLNVTMIESLTSSKGAAAFAATEATLMTRALYSSPLYTPSSGTPSSKGTTPGTAGSNSGGTPPVLAAALHVNMAVAFWLLGRREAAWTSVNNALRLAPGSSAVCLITAYSFLQDDNVPGAVAALKEYRG